MEKLIRGPTIFLAKSLVRLEKANHRLATYIHYWTSETVGLLQDNVSCRVGGQAPEFIKLIILKFETLDFTRRAIF